MDMKRAVKDGWHIVAGYKVYVENGYVKRGIIEENVGAKTSFPYVAGKYDGWDLDQYVTVNNFRRKVKAGTAKMF